jgi:hypothetical protein
MTEPSDAFILLICEGPSDPRVARGFAERVCQEQIEWLRDVPEALLPWRGLEPNDEYLKWSAVRNLYRATDLPDVNGRFEDQPAKPKSTGAIKAFRLAQLRSPRAVVIVLDVDNELETHAGLEQARRKHEAIHEVSHPVVVGAANRCREAWVLAGFNPRTDQEQKRFQTLTRELTFDPSREPHRLRHPRSGQVRHAKDVLESLCDGDLSREQPCWEETALETLKRNGEACGLKAYLEEVEAKLVAIYDSGKAQ